MYFIDFLKLGHKNSDIIQNINEDVNNEIVKYCENLDFDEEYFKTFYKEHKDEVATFILRNIKYKYADRFNDEEFVRLIKGIIDGLTGIKDEYIDTYTYNNAKKPNF